MKMEEKTKEERHKNKAKKHTHTHQKKIKVNNENGNMMEASAATGGGLTSTVFRYDICNEHLIVFCFGNDAEWWRVAPFAKQKKRIKERVVQVLFFVVVVVATSFTGFFLPSCT